MQSTLNNAEAEDLWPQIAPLLEEAMLRLGRADRDALVLRFFEGRNLREVGSVLGTSEDATKMRVRRALEKLRDYFSRRGVNSTAETLAGAISANSIQTAPAMLAKTATAVALTKGATASISTLALVKGATMKGFMTFGSISGLLALFGSAYISFQARAADSKSTREEQFMLRTFRKRTIPALLWLVAYFIALKLDFFRSPICFDYFAAVFVFYFFCVDWLILARETNLRRRQIQIEDNSYVEAEWTMPRKATDPAAGPVKMVNLLKAVRFAALGIVSGAMVGFQIAGGQQTFARAWVLRSRYPVVERSLIFAALLIIAGCSLAMFFSFLGWQKRPRFLPIRGDGPPPRTLVVFPIMFPIVIGLIMLAVFNLFQYLVNDGLHDSTMASPNEIIIFNAVVISVYAAFTIRTIGILARRRKFGMNKI